MKKLILSLMTLVGVVASSEAQYNTRIITLNSNVVTNIVVETGWNVRRVTVSGVGSNPAYIFYDYNTNGGLALTSLQYSNTTSFSNLVTIDPYTNTVIFTNSLGLTQTNRYRGIYQYWTNVATATASNAQPIGAIATQSGIPYTLDVNWNITKGITVRGTNNTAGFIIVEYQ